MNIFIGTLFHFSDPTNLIRAFLLSVLRVSVVNFLQHSHHHRGTEDTEEYTLGYYLSFYTFCDFTASMVDSLS
jgi:hypothetical protein